MIILILIFFIINFVLFYITGMIKLLDHSSSMIHTESNMKFHFGYLTNIPSLIKLIYKNQPNQVSNLGKN